MDVVRRYVCKNDLEAITLMTERDNPAISFYEKGGFAHVESMAFLADKSV
jgi:ribosomal protein S18 acetylase RimI-like enzyme